MGRDRFVSTERIAVHTEDDEANVLYIKPRMDVSTNALVRSAMVIIQTQASVTEGMTPNDATMRFDVAAYNMALLIHNVVGWSGPDFDHMPFNTANLKRMDPDDPLLEAALRQIQERNLPKVASPNLSNGHGKSGLTPSTGRKKQDADLSPTSA